MFYRKDAVFMAVAGILASAGYAVAADTAVKAPLALDNAVVDNAPSGLLMQGLDKVGAGDPLKRAGLNIYGWIEGGYTFDHRHRKTVTPIAPGPFNHEYGGVFTLGGYATGGGDRNHFMLNQVDIRFEKFVKPDPNKWDVGGLVELMYGTDSGSIHANGLTMGNENYNGRGGTDFFNSGKLADDRFNPQYQVDITQAYVDVNVPVGNGLKLRAGKFVTLMGYETIDPRGNPFYSHSWIFSALPFTQTGIVGFYSLNDQWAVAGGISRGWDQALEDNNGCSIDALGQVIYTPTKQIQAILNWTVGPENDRDSSHYRTAIDGILVWKATEQLKLGLEVLYVYDGGRNGFAPAGVSHAYGDNWGASLYASYTINEYLTANARLEKFHSSVSNFYDQAYLNSFLVNSDDTNVYGITLGVTVTPFPKDPIGKNLVIRPEIRYNYCEDHIFIESNGGFKDQLTFGTDVIFSF